MTYHEPQYVCKWNSWSKRSIRSIETLWARSTWWLNLTLNLSQLPSILDTHLIPIFVAQWEPLESISSTLEHFYQFSTQILTKLLDLKQNCILGQILQLDLSVFNLFSINYHFDTHSQLISDLFSQFRSQIFIYFLVIFYWRLRLDLRISLKFQIWTTHFK